MTTFGLVMGLAAAAAASNPTPTPFHPMTTPITASVTRDEWIAQADGLFRRLDREHQGYFDKATLKRIFWSPDSPDGSHIPFPVGGEAKFEAIDSNHDGRITELEYDDFAGHVFDTFARDGRLYPAYLVGSTRFQALLDNKPAP